MTDYLFDKLYQVRSLREQLAQSELAGSRHKLVQADHELFSKQTHLERHRLFQKKMEALLFEEIDRKEVTVNEFENYCGRISDLRTEERSHLESVRQAEVQKDSARSEVDRLAAVFQNRCRESTKLKEFCKTLNTKVEEEKSRQSEEEMEEMAVNRFSHNVPLTV